MPKKAKSIEEQIEILRSRGMKIQDVEKAKEVLLDIGYYRLGFYAFHFEENPYMHQRNHIYKNGVEFEQLINLYYFDHDLRHLLMRYISRIEVNLRTYITYTVSNYYKDDPIWFVNPKYVDRKFIDGFNQLTYKDLRQNPCIANHHKCHLNDRYAPAWKTLEFMTLGSIISLYNELQDKAIKLEVAKHYGLRTIKLFANFLHTLKVIRNACAHGNHIFDLKLLKAVKKGPLQHYDENHRNDIYSVLLVLTYFLHYISKNREQEFLSSLREHIEKCKNKEIIIILNDFMEKILSNQK